MRSRLWQWVSGSAGRERRRVAILAQHPYVNRADHEPLAAVKVVTASLVTFHSEILSFTGLISYLYIYPSHFFFSRTFF